MEYVITEIWFQLISPGSGIAPQNHRYRYIRIYTQNSIQHYLMYILHNFNIDCNNIHNVFFFTCRLRAFPNTFSASAIIAWLIRSGHAVTRYIACMCLRCCCVVCHLYCLITLLLSTSVHVHVYTVCAL